MSELPLAPLSTPSPETAQPVAAGLPPALARVARVVLQAAALAALWAIADQLVRICRLPVPAGIVGLAVLLVLLMTGWVRPAAVRDGANWLLTDMLLFFIPATVAAVQYGGLFRAEGWRLALVVLGTMLVMGAVALAVERAARFERRLALSRAMRGGSRERKPVIPIRGQA
ncbi:CidA/LrgA family protein [Burkholderia gladioli]|uniref:CidA/LrgA family protein n=1 Tax=Burkholderia gladioli TaxID=28095 RepID=UPI003F79A05F